MYLPYMNKYVSLYHYYYRVEENFGGYKLWWNSKENIIGRIRFGSFMMKINWAQVKTNLNKQLCILKFSVCNFAFSHTGWMTSDGPTGCCSYFSIEFMIRGYLDISFVLVPQNHFLVLVLHFEIILVGICFSIPSS